MIRKHGVEPFKFIAVHGGPGVAGDLYDMCKTLSSDYSIIETLHEGLSIDGQIDEVDKAVEMTDDKRVTLVGHSWGAWLVLYYAAKYPEKVKHLILISSGALEEKYLSDMNRIRNERFSEEDLLNIREYFQKMNETIGEKANEYFQKAGSLFHKTDSFDEETVDLGEKVSVKKVVYEKIWSEVAQKRKNGELMRALKNVECQISVIHGDYDPHPFEGVKNPIVENDKRAEFYLLHNCGHIPWREKVAKNDFYSAMRKILKRR